MKQTKVFTHFTLIEGMCITNHQKNHPSLASQAVPFSQPLYISCENSAMKPRTRAEMTWPIQQHSEA